MIFFALAVGTISHIRIGERVKKFERCGANKSKMLHTVFQTTII